MEKDAQNCINGAVNKAGRKAAPPAEQATYRFTLETDAVCHYQHNYFLFKKEIIMKKLIFVFSFVALTLLFLGKENAFACPTGFYTAQVQINHGGTTFDIAFCYTCSIGPLGTNIVDINIQPQGGAVENYYDLLDVAGQFNQAFTEMVEDKVIEEWANHCTIGPCDDPNGPVTITVNYPTCFKLISNPRLVTPEPPAEPYYEPRIHWENCNESESYCQATYNICRTPEGLIDYTPPGYWHYNNSECDPVPDDIPPVGEDWDTPWIINCYLMWPCGDPD